MTDLGPEISPAGPPGWPGRIVARVRRDVPLVLLDGLVVVPAYLIPLVLRFHGSVPWVNWRYFLFLLPLIVIIHLSCNYLFGLYGQMWRYASVQEARSVVMAGAASLVAVVGLDVLVGRGHRPIPLSVVLLGCATKAPRLGSSVTSRSWASDCSADRTMVRLTE